jgi:glycosyltransferase involved in cell wall biosynthesis
MTSDRPPAAGAQRPPIAYVAGQFPLRSETFVWREVRELRRRGWTVHTFGLHAPAEVPAELAELRAATHDIYADASRMPLRAAELVAAARVGALAAGDAAWPGEPTAPRARATLVAQAQAGCRLAWRLRELGVRHVHAHFAHAPASVAMYAARAAGISFSFTGHANDLFQRRQLLRRKLSRAAFVACISEWHRALYQSIVPRPDAAYPIVRCGVDVEQLSPAHRMTTAHGARRPRLLTVCRLVEKKGVDLLLRAVAQLRDERLDVDLTIAGDGPLRATLEALTDELALRERVIFTGAVDADHVRELLLASDAFALPCRVDASGDRDGIPVVLIEAMACGLPVVSGDLPAIRELVADGRTGRLVPSDQVGALAGALTQIVADAATAQRLGQAGRERVLSEFSLTGNVGRIEMLFMREWARII